jgi:DNA-binding transcriptional LysR family regulator
LDRIDAMKVFVAALDEGSLGKAGRKLGKSPTAVSRAIAFLETHVGVTLLHRTTRSIKLSEAGERYASVCRKIINDLEEADVLLAGERSTPRGTLTITTPVVAGEDVVRSVLDAFLDTYPAVSVRLYLLDRPANLIDEGIDVALRIAHLAGTSHVAVKLGEVRRVVASAPRYLGSHPKIEEPSDLIKHQIIAMTHFGLDSWSFPPPKGSSTPRTVQFTPRLTVNSVRGAIASAVEGHGVTRLFFYHIAEQVREDALRIVLAKYEFPPLPMHLITSQGRLSLPKVRAFVDFAVPRLKAHFARLTHERGRAIQPRGGKVSADVVRRVSDEAQHCLRKVAAAMATAV